MCAVDLVAAFVDRVWNAGDVSNLTGQIANAYTVHHDPGDPWEGQTLTRLDFAERVRQSRAPVPDQEFKIVDAFRTESKVAIFWTWRGTHLGEIAGFEPTGRTLRMSGATSYFVHDRLIAGHWQIADRLSIYRQLQMNSVDNFID